MAKKKFSRDQWLGLLLIIAALLIWVPMPFPAKAEIGALIVVVIGVFKLIAG